MHHEPDLGRVGCLGCDEPIAPADLHAHHAHLGKSCCRWHPYHYWCIRGVTKPPVLDRCADCGGVLSDDELAAATRWAATLPARVHGAPAPRPAPLRLVAWWCVERATRSEPPAAERCFEIVHADCPVADPWRARLREAPADRELRAVYADHLEQTGDARRAEFVRLVVRRRQATGSRAAFLDRQLRALRQPLPSGWCRDVARGAS